MHLGDGAEIDGGMMRALVDVSVKAPKFARIGSRELQPPKSRSAARRQNCTCARLDVNEEKADKLIAAGALERPRAPPAEAKSFSRSSQPRQ